MRIPRDLSGGDLVKALKVFGYEITRQTGSHIRVTTSLRGEHHLTIPAHRTLATGTLSAILAEVAEHAGIARGEVLSTLFR